MNVSNIKSIKIHYNQHVYLISYSLINGSYKSDEFGNVVSYGLQAKLFFDDQDDELDNVAVADICCQHRDAIELYDMVIRNNVFPVHLRDIIMDNIP
ncbi:MAG: DUF6514 family protein [Oscillospiraceae bacterium]|nr:DUF6514 family protein [Oscillospiraceae bacterium]MDD4545932.1 DUF6514 family protein [Oscillospiraceae bacterium]